MKKFDALQIPFHAVLIDNGIGKNRHPTDRHRRDMMTIFGRVPLLDFCYWEGSSEMYFDTIHEKMTTITLIKASFT